MSTEKYEARSIDNVYERRTLEAVVEVAIKASHRTGESVGVWLADGTYWATVSAHAKRGKATIQLMEV
jgi:hypothetical protein